MKKLYIPLPDSASRMQLLRITMSTEGVEHQLSESDFDVIVRRCEGYSGSDMAALCKEASMGPIRAMSSLMAADDITHIDSRNVRPIQITDFDEAFHSIRPSVNQKDLTQYIRYDNTHTIETLARTAMHLLSCCSLNGSRFLCALLPSFHQSDLLQVEPTVWQFSDGTGGYECIRSRRCACR